MEEKFNLVLFDLDGTIINSAPGIFASFAHALQKYGKEINVETGRHVLGPPLRDSFLRYVPQQDVEDAIATYREYYIPHGMYEASLYTGVAEMLLTLRKAGYRLALATSKPEAFARLILQRFGIDVLFDYIGGASFDTSRDTKAQVIEYVLSQPCFAQLEAVMIGDRDNDMQGAAKCGVPAVGVLYGYGSAEELAPYAPLALVQTMQQLQDFLLQHKA